MGQPERAWETCQEMQQQSLAPNVITYNALLSACEKGKQPERAWETFQEMQQQSLAPNVIIYFVTLCMLTVVHESRRDRSLEFGTTRRFRKLTNCDMFDQLAK